MGITTQKTHTNNETFNVSKYFKEKELLDIVDTLESKLNDSERARLLAVMKARFEVAEISQDVVNEVDQVKKANEMIKLCSAEKLDMQKIEDKYKRLSLGSLNRLNSSAFAYMFGTPYFGTILPLVEKDINKVYAEDKNKANELIASYREKAQNSRLNQQQLGE